MVGVGMNCGMPGVLSSHWSPQERLEEVVVDVSMSYNMS